MHAMQKVFSLSVLALAAIAFSQAPANLYSPSRTVKDQGISLVGWGSGTIAETDETAYEGASSLRVSTRNFFQGGIMTYANPVNLAGAFQDPNNLLMFTVRIADATMTMGGGSAASGSGAGGGNTTGAEGREGAGSGGGSRSGATMGSTAQGPTGLGDLDKIRVIITTSDSKKSEAFLPLRTSVADAKGWIRVGIPLKAIAGFAATNQMVKSVAVSANAPGSVYVGEVKILNDATPIYGEILVGDMNIGSGTAVNLTASGQAGASILKYTWNIQSADEPLFTFEGQNISYRFRKPGTYKVSVTISDTNGLKKPYTSSAATITVN